MANILIVAKGSYGDMFPIYAIALLLKDRGHDLTIATNIANKGAALSMGFRVLEIDQPVHVVTHIKSDKLRRLLAGHSSFIKSFMYTAIETEYENLLPAAEDSDLIIGNQQAHTAAMVKEKTATPWVYCVASPLALLATHQNPSLFPWVHHLQKLSMESEPLQKLCVGIGRGLARLLMRNITAFRRRLGLNTRHHPAFEAMHSTDLNLLLTSPALINGQQGLPPHTYLTGFTWFEPEFLTTPAKQERVQSFLDAGPRPVVFALGGDKRSNPGSYFDESIKACKMLGLRGIIVAAERFHDRLSSDDSILVTSYVPYSILFRNALAVVHSGGIGTIGWCIRYGLPSLLAPSSVDQFDNAYRAYRAGVADLLPRRHYSARRVAQALDKLLRNQERKRFLERISETVATENGAGIAVNKIEALLGEILEKPKARR